MVVSGSTARAPERLDLQDGKFVATRKMMAALAKSAVQCCNYRVDAADDAAGTVTFTTGMTMGSWTGVSGTVVYREVAPYLFEVTGAAKQNVRGGQMVALDLFSEARGKVDNVIAEMCRQANAGEVSSPSAEAASAGGCVVLLVGFAIAPAAMVASRFV